MLSKEVYQYVFNGAQLEQCFRQEVGKMCYEERIRQRFYLETVSKKTGVSPKTLEAFERGLKRFNWSCLAALLSLYRLRLEVRFVPVAVEKKV